MKNNLIKLAEKFNLKYSADVQQEVHQSLANASLNEGTRKLFGIIPFIQMINKDQIKLSFNVEKSGNTVTVSNLKVEPWDKANLASKYESLKTSIKKYLETHNVYSVPEFNVHLEYEHENNPEL
jgi:hypothetical protein